MNSPILTFSIPTYNGAGYLAQAIDSIVSQLAADNIRDVEILISDNCSQDDTRKIAEKYVAAFPGSVRYRRNDENLGYDRNLDLSIRGAKGEYVWIIGDDDYLTPGGVKIIRSKLLALKSPRPAVLVAPVAYYDMRREVLTEPVLEAEDAQCPDGNSFFKKTMWDTSAMSSLILNRADWEKIDVSEGFGSQWVHLLGLIKLMKNRQGVVLAAPNVVVRIRNERWEGNFGNQLMAGVKHLDVFSRLSSEGYDPSIFKALVCSRISTNLMAILTLKPSDLTSKVEIAKGMARHLKMYPVFWLLHLPALMFVPNLPRVKQRCLKILRAVHPGRAS